MEYPNPQQSGPVNVPPPYWQQPPAPPAVYRAGVKEGVFGGLMFLIALGLFNCIVYAGAYLGFAVFGCAYILCTGIYLMSKQKKLSAYSVILLVLSLVICAGFARSNDGFVQFVMLCFLFFSVHLGLCIGAGQNRRKPGVFTSLADAFRSAFSITFGKLPAGMRGIGQSVPKGSTVFKNLLSIGVGLLIALPVLAIVLPLLTSADAAFDGLMSKLPEMDSSEGVITLIFGSLAWVLFYCRGVGLAHADPVTVKEPTARKGIAPITVNTVLLAVTLVYGVYLVSQLAYFFGGFAGILPESYTMAEYARRGFFEMAALCLINLTVILFAAGFVRKDKTVGLFTRLLCLFIGLITLLFVATASAKMFMYIQAYGLTRLRVLTEVIMVFLGLTTATVCLWLFVPRLPYMKIILITALVIGAVVLWVDVDTVVAAYNVNAYLSGQLETVDIAYLCTLGDSAVPYIARLTQVSDRTVVKKAYSFLELHQSRISDWRSWNYSTYLAQQFRK